MADSKTQFFWVSVHGADPEPAERSERDGRACVFTLGCADPFYLDEGAILFVERDQGWPRPMTRPEHPDKHAARIAAMDDGRRKGRKIAVTHGWRGPR